MPKDGEAKVPPDLEKSGDLFDVFTYSATADKKECRHTESALKGTRSGSSQSGQANNWHKNFAAAWVGFGGHVAVASNNSATAVNPYVRSNEHNIVEVFTRDFSSPTLLKQNPFLVNQAIATLGISPQETSLIGDSKAGHEATMNAGIRFIGYSNKPGRTLAFDAARAEAIVSDMRLL
ncbi:HAD family hydrolase [Saccharothrix obliqua]|uniref:HAD family hydrolase n=1 Tax=Saccharothrix obliqua TaxID=2861747 RepID=UPI001C5E0C39|nr:HAD hydrolase-like protein [Saccharothrix obliqua]MBW4720743.1 HAD hydrolase-like protein [Saccharothrix obliqua]